MVGALEIIMLAIAEIGEGDINDGVVPVIEYRGHAQRDGRADAVFLLEIPFALLAPAKTGGPRRDDRLAGGVVDRDGLPFGIVPLTEAVLEIGGAQQPVGHESAILADQLHQHRHVGIATAIVLEIGRLPVEMIFAQDDMAHRHRQRGVRALLWIEPDIAEFGRFGIIG
jgi:hypothetical protein